LARIYKIKALACSSECLVESFVQVLYFP